MYEYVISESQEHVGYAWAQGNCEWVRMGHKHEPHIDGTRACPGYLPVLLMAFPATKPPEPIYNREKERIDLDPDIASPEAIRALARKLGYEMDDDDVIRSSFAEQIGTRVRGTTTRSRG